MALEHKFLNLLADTLHSTTLFWNNSPSRLKTLQGMAGALNVACLKLGVLHTRRWYTFVDDALHRMKRCFVIVVIALLEVPWGRAVNKGQRDALLFAPEVFVCALFLCRMW